MEKHIILGVHVTDRLKNAAPVQAALTEHGCNIKTRLGLHDTSPNACSPNGLLLLELAGDEVQCAELEKKLRAVEGIEVQKMLFEH